MRSVYCVIDGVSMTEVEFKAWKKKHTTKVVAVKKPSVRMYRYSDMVNEWLSMTIKKIRVLNSIISYQAYSYRYWGGIARTVLHIKEIEKPFDKTYVSIRQMQRTIHKIENCHNKRETQDLLYKLNWQLEEVSKNIVALNKGIEKSEVLYGLANSGCINGTGKRLGLKIISLRAADAVKEIEQYNEDLLKLIKLADA